MNTKKEIQKQIDCSNIHYNLFGFNQYTVMACCKIENDKLIKLNTNDLIILRWFYDLYDKKKRNLNGKEYETYTEINPKDNQKYKRIKYEMAVNAFPFLNISEQTVSLIFKKLVDLKIVYRWHKKIDGKVYYCPDDEMRWILTNPPESTEQTQECINNKLFMIHKKLCTDWYYFMDRSIINYLCNNNIGNNTIGNNSIINNTKNEFSFPDNFRKDSLEENELKLLTEKDKSIQYNEKLKTEFNEVLEILNKNNIPIRLTKNTKTCEKLYKQLKKILSGHFADTVNLEKSPDVRKWAKRNNITQALSMVRKIDSMQKLKKQIRVAAENYNTMKTDNAYWPADKSKIQTSAPDFLYNAYSGKSYFLQCLANEPEYTDTALKNIKTNNAEKKLKDDYGIDRAIIRKHIFGNDSGLSKWTDEQWGSALYCTRDLVEWYNEHKEHLEILNRKKVGNYKTFLKNVGKWIHTQSRVYSNYLEISSRGWGWFCEWAMDTLDIQYNMNKANMTRVNKILKQRELKKQVEDEANAGNSFPAEKVAQTIPEYAL